MTCMYAYVHECEKKPAWIELFKANSTNPSQFIAHQYLEHEGRFSTVLYNFEYCPYCGKRLEKDE